MSPLWFGDYAINRSKMLDPGSSPSSEVGSTKFGECWIPVPLPPPLVSRPIFSVAAAKGGNAETRRRQVDKPVPYSRPAGIIWAADDLATLMRALLGGKGAPGHKRQS